MRSSWLALAIALGAAGAAQASSCPNVVTTNIATDGNGNECQIRADLRGNVSINAATLNQIGSVALDGGRGSSGWQITGLAAATGAVLTPVYTNDGVTWNPMMVIFNGAPVTTLSGADGPVEQIARNHAAIGFKVTTVGTGTITATYSASVNSMDPMLGNATGNQSDSAWSGSGNGTVVAIQKALYAQAVSLLSNTTGLATSANQATGNASLSSMSTTLTAGVKADAMPAGAAIAPLSLSAGSDAAMTGLTLPGRVCLSNPQFVINSSGNTTTAPNTTPIAVNWAGGSAWTNPVIVLSPGQQDVCKYIPTSNAPHVAAPAATQLLASQ